MSERMVAAGVLAGVYIGGDCSHALVHAVVVDDAAPRGTWPVVSVVCGRAKPGSVTDDSTQWQRLSEVTCGTCACRVVCDCRHNLALHAAEFGSSDSPCSGCSCLRFTLPGGAR